MFSKLGLDKDWIDGTTVLQKITRDYFGGEGQKECAVMGKGGCLNYSRFHTNKERYQKQPSLGTARSRVQADGNTSHVSCANRKNAMFLKADYHPAFASRGREDVADRVKNNLRQQSLSGPSAEFLARHSRIPTFSSHPRHLAAATLVTRPHQTTKKPRQS
jgi:hypothetical protein